MPQDYYPSGPFLGRLPDAGAFDALREDWLLGFAESTARAYKSDLEDFREWCVSEGLSPLQPTASGLATYLHSMGVRGYAASTMRRRRTTLRGFLRHLARRDFAEMSLADGLDLPSDVTSSER